MRSQFFPIEDGRTKAKEEIALSHCTRGVDDVMAVSSNSKGDDYRGFSSTKRQRFASTCTWCLVKKGWEHRLGKIQMHGSLCVGRIMRGKEKRKKMYKVTSTWMGGLS